MAAPEDASVARTVQISEDAVASEMAEYRIAVAALSARVAAAGPKGPARPRRATPVALGGLAPDDAPMVWYAAPVEAMAPAVLRCCALSLVRSGVEKTSSRVLKLARGMEVVADGRARASDGTLRYRVVDPVRGWASAKTLEAVTAAAPVEATAGVGAASAPAPPPPARWASATGSDGYFLPEATVEGEAYDFDRGLRIHASHDCGGGGAGHETVPVFYLPRSALSAVKASAEARRRPPTVERIRGVEGAFLATGVLPDATCAALVALSEAMGRRVAAVPGDDLRRNATQQCVFADVDGCLRAALNVVLPLCPFAGNEGWRADDDRKREDRRADAVPAPGALYGINAKCRFLRYAEGDSVQPHRDTAWKGCDVAESIDATVPDARSWLTVIVYLNDGFRGGETTFFVDGEGGDYGRVAVEPKRGAALLFFHGHHAESPLHEGSAIREPDVTKHVLRTDVLYRDAAL